MGHPATSSSTSGETSVISVAFREANLGLSGDPLAKIVSLSHARAEMLSQSAERIVKRAFDQSFPPEIVEKLGLIIVANGSFGRKRLVSGRSDIDIYYYATKTDEQSLDSVEKHMLQVALERFSTSLMRQMQPLRLKVADRNQFRKITDLADEINASAAGGINHIKIACEGVTKLFSSRAICGDSEGVESFSQLKETMLDKLMNDPALRQQAIQNLVKLGSDLIAEESLHKAVQHIKDQPITLATISSALCELLKNDENAQAIDYLGENILKRSDFLYAIREFLPEKKESLSFEIHDAVMDAFASIYGEQPGIVPLTYRSSALIAAYFAYLRDEASKQGHLNVTPEVKSHVEAVFGAGPAVEEVRAMFYKHGNVAISLYLGLLQQGFDETLPEFAALDSLPDNNHYQTLTLDKHVVYAVATLDKLVAGQGDPRFVSLTQDLSPDELAALYFGLTFHDSGKPEEMRRALVAGGLKMDPEFHAEFGAGLARTAAERIELSAEQVRLAEALVKYHLWFRHTKSELRDNMAQGISALPEELRSPQAMKMLALLAYADDFATDLSNWNGLSANHIHELCHAYICLLENRPNGLILNNADEYAEFLFGQHQGRLLNENLTTLRQHLSLLPASHLRLSPETICAFFHMSKALSVFDEPQVQIAQHDLSDYDHTDGKYRYDILFVAKDRPFLASNIAEVVTKSKLQVHSAAFSGSSDGIVYNCYTVTSDNDIGPLISKIIGDIKDRGKAEELKVPSIERTLVFKDNVHVSASQRVGRAGDPAMTEITLNTQDQDRLLLRFLVGLNNLGLEIVDADLTTYAGHDKIRMVKNRFQVFSRANPYQPMNDEALRKSLLMEFRNRDELQS